MQARPLLILVSSIVVCAFALTVVATTARAHDDAAWIMANPGYVDANGAHCCGPSDCRRESATKFREAPEGVYVAIGAGDEVLMPRRLVGRGLYPSQDDDWWICIRDGIPRCAFKPTTGG